MDDQDSTETLTRPSSSAGEQRERSPWRSGRQRPGVYRTVPARIAAGSDVFSEGKPDEFIAARDSLSRRALVLVDLIAAAGALMLVVALMGDENRRLWPALAAAPLLTLAMKAAGLYDRDENLIRKTTLDEAPSA